MTLPSGSSQTRRLRLFFIFLSKMVLACCVDGCRSIKQPSLRISFHRFPMEDPERLRQWLFMLNMDLNTPFHALSKFFVCQNHFQAKDYYNTLRPKCRRRLLKTKAIPTRLIRKPPCSEFSEPTDAYGNGLVSLPP